MYIYIHTYILFWYYLEKIIHLFLPERFPNFWGLNRRSFRTLKDCVHRRYPKFSIFSEILLLCCLCKNISYNFLGLVMLYLTHLYNKTFL